jgi:hypothetical protein
MVLASLMYGQRDSSFHVAIASVEATRGCTQQQQQQRHWWQQV